MAINIYFQKSCIAFLEFDGKLSENTAETKPYGEGDYTTLMSEAFESIKHLEFLVTQTGNQYSDQYEVMVNGVIYHAGLVPGHGVILDTTPSEWQGLEGSDLLDAMKRFPISGYPIPFTGKPYEMPYKEPVGSRASVFAGKSGRYG